MGQNERQKGRKNKREMEREIEEKEIVMLSEKQRERKSEQKKDIELLREREIFVPRLTGLVKPFQPRQSKGYYKETKRNEYDIQRGS